jgi:linoleoyl-CoA desaturase
LIGYTLIVLVTGFIISIVFQLAHVVEDLNFPEPNPETKKIDNEWAIHQIETTANFATKSKLVSWYVGGLNFQVEHHLFPKISHIHYPQINQFVRETCEQFNLNYIEFPTMLGAVKSHLSHLKQIGVAA